jgi:hypothetical protein
VVINHHTALWRQGMVPGLKVLPLHEFGTEHAALVRWAPGTRFTPHRHWGGEEILVLEGVFEDEHGRYPAGSWLRSPHGSMHAPFSEEGMPDLGEDRAFAGLNRPAPVATSVVQQIHLLGQLEQVIAAVAGAAEGQHRLGQAVDMGGELLDVLLGDLAADDRLVHIGQAQRLGGGLHLRSGGLLRAFLKSGRLLITDLKPRAATSCICSGVSCPAKPISWVMGWLRWGMGERG